MPINFIAKVLEKQLEFCECWYNNGIIDNERYDKIINDAIISAKGYMFHEFSEEVVYDDACITFEQFRFYSQIACE